MFAWACADSEPVKENELSELYRMHKENEKWGSAKWVCKKRNMQPQHPIVRDMKKEKVWCNMMSALPSNPDKAIKVKLVT